MAGRAPGARKSDMWIRARDTLPDDPLLHTCVLAYASDKPMLGTTALSPPLRDDPRPVLHASLDHSMWFQRPLGSTTGCS